MATRLLKPDLVLNREGAKRVEKKPRKMKGLRGTLVDLLIDKRGLTVQASLSFASDG